MASGGGGNLVFSPTAALLRFREAPPSVLSVTSGGNILLQPPAALIRFRAHPAVSMAQTEKAQSGLVKVGRGVAKLLYGGTVAVYPSSALLRFRSPPLNAITPSTSELRFRRGPITKLPPGWPEGAPYQVGIPTGVEGAYFSLLFLGGHDGQDKVQGGGVQVINYDPTWSVLSDGSWCAVVLNSANLKLWFNFGTGWHYLTLT